MRWVLIAVGALISIVALAWGVGAMLPRDHVATRMAQYRQPPEVVWQALTDADAFPAWRTGVTAVRRLPEEQGLPGWVETGSTGDLPLRIIEAQPPRRLVMRIATDALPFGGTWTYEVAAADGGATLRITEDGFVEPALFRVMSRFVFGHHATMERYLTDLGRKFGEDVTPQP